MNGTPYKDSFVTTDGKIFKRLDTGEVQTLKQLTAKRVVPSTFWASGQVFFLPREIHLGRTSEG